MFFIFPCTKCGCRIMAENTAEEKRIFTTTCKNCRAFHFFYFEKITRKTKKKKVKTFTEVDK